MNNMVADQTETSTHTTGNVSTFAKVGALLSLPTVATQSVPGTLVTGAHSSVVVQNATHSVIENAAHLCGATGVTQGSYNVGQMLASCPNGVVYEGISSAYNLSPQPLSITLPECMVNVICPESIVPSWGMIYGLSAAALMVGGGAVIVVAGYSAYQNREAIKDRAINFSEWFGNTCIFAKKQNHVDVENTNVDETTSIIAEQPLRRKFFCW